MVVENGVREIYSARYYNPQTGRFLSRDPEDGNPRDSRSLHKYLYADGDPVNRIDPRGRGALIEGFLLRVVVVGAVAVQSFEQLDPNSQAIVVAAVACAGNGVKNLYDLVGFDLELYTGYNLPFHDDPSPGDTPIDTACKDLAFAFPSL